MGKPCSNERSVDHDQNLLAWLLLLLVRIIIAKSFAEITLKIAKKKFSCHSIRSESR